jgi:hypothetical protein
MAEHNCLDNSSKEIAESLSLDLIGEIIGEIKASVLEQGVLELGLVLHHIEQAIKQGCFTQVKPYEPKGLI